jgi:hypothetical protein
MDACGGATTTEKLLADMLPFGGSFLEPVLPVRAALVFEGVFLEGNSPDPSGKAGCAVTDAARGVTPLSLAEIIRNIVYVFSYLVLPDRYWLYRSAKFLLSRSQVGVPNWTRPPELVGRLLAIEACAHSGSTFLFGSIRSDLRDSVVSHIHRPWSLNRCLGHGIPTILLVRDPLDTCLSRHWRSVARQGYGMTISMIAALTVWLAYYRCAWCYRERLCIIMFPELTGDFPSVRRRVEALSQVPLLEAPTPGHRNEFVGERRRLRLCFLSRWLLKAARLQYHKFDLASRAQREGSPMITPLSKTAQALALCRKAVRRHSSWVKPGIVLLCTFVVGEPLVDWLCIQELGLDGFGLAVILGAVFGLIVLVNAVRRLDYIERVVNISSDYETLRAELDSAVCIIAAILFILPGVGGDLAGIVLLVPPTRYALSTGLARAGLRRYQRIVGGAGR